MLLDTEDRAKAALGINIVAQALLIDKATPDEWPCLGSRQHVLRTQLKSIGEAGVGPVLAVYALARGPVFDVVDVKIDQGEHSSGAEVSQR